MAGAVDWLVRTHHSSLVPESFCFTEVGWLNSAFSQTALQLEPHMRYGIPQAEGLVQDTGGKKQHEVAVAASRDIRSPDKHKGGDIWCPDPDVLGDGDRQHWQSWHRAALW